MQHISFFSILILHMICFHLLLRIILDLSYIAKWFSFAFCVVIKNVVSCNLHICYEEKKNVAHIAWKVARRKKTGWNSTNSPTYVHVTSRCVLKLIQISLIYLYSEQSIFTSEMKFWYVAVFQKHNWYL